MEVLDHRIWVADKKKYSDTFYMYTYHFIIIIVIIHHCYRYFSKNPIKVEAKCAPIALYQSVSLQDLFHPNHLRND